MCDRKCPSDYESTTLIDRITSMLALNNAYAPELLPNMRVVHYKRTEVSQSYKQEIGLRNTNKNTQPTTSNIFLRILPFSSHFIAEKYISQKQRHANIFRRKKKILNIPR